MKQAVVAWMRVVLPHWGWAPRCTVTVLLVEVVDLFWLLRIGQVGDVALAFRYARLLCLGAWASVYGIYRLAEFHPAANGEYRRWLEQTPWKLGKPLPGGPIHLVLQDLVILALLMLMTREFSPLVFWIPAAFLISYLTVLAVMTHSVGEWAAAYLLGFGLGCIGLAGRSPLASLMTAIATYPVALLAIHRSLSRFPWDASVGIQSMLNRQNRAQTNGDRLGWPFDALSPKAPRVLVPYHDGVCASLLVGWFAFVIHFQNDLRLRAMICGMSILVIGSMTMLCRVWDYRRAHRPPIDFWGRIRSGSWIIPGYDVIFVAPILAIVVLLLTQVGPLVWFLKYVPLQNATNPVLDGLAIACSSVGIAGSMLIVCVMGPVLERWQLTGTHRIVFEHDLLGKHPNSPFVEL